MTNPDDGGRPQEDLVICADHNYSFDNRWAFTGDLVDYGTVEHFDGSQMRRKHSSLKRIKIHGRLPCRPMAALLELLCTNSRLEHLEIDTLEIHCDLPNEYHFNFLKRFSVDEIKIVDKFGLEVKGKSRTIRLIDNPSGDALNRLEHLYLGSNSIDHLDRSIFRGAIHTIGFAKVGATLRELTTPYIVEMLCEQIFRIEHRLRPNGFISNLISGKFGDVRILRFNLDKLRSTAFQPPKGQLVFLKDLYSHLRRVSAETCQPRNRPIAKYRGEKKIFLNGVRLDLERLQFDDYHFELPLVAMHYHNHLSNRLELGTCSSVIEVHCLDLPEKLELIAFDKQPASVAACSLPGNKFEQLRFTGLMRLYPNLRVVIVENRDKRPLEPRPMLVFLSICKSLTELRLIHAGFSTGFYKQLAGVRSLSTLHAFTLIEPLGFPFVRTDFAFLNSKYLRRLRTNLANRTTMQACVLERMQPSAVFEFQFWHPKIAYLSYYHRFQRLDNDRRWDLLVEKENFLRQRSKQAILGGAETYEQLLITFNQPNYFAITSHWTDDQASSGICNFL